MKLKPGECAYPLPDCGQIISVALDEGEREARGFVYLMQQISPADWDRMRGDPSKPPLRGRPMFYAWLGPELGLRIWPAPDAAHDLRVRYFPHMREA